MIGRIAAAALLVVGLTAGAAGAKPPQHAGTEVGPPHTTTTFDPSRGCAGDGPVAAQGWCNYYDGPTSGAAGQPVELGATVCRLPGQEPHTLQVDNGEQAQFAAMPENSGQNSALWTWSKGHHFSPYGTTFNLAAGSCLRWHVTWNVVDDAGRPLAPGVYSLTARPLAHEAGSIRAQAYLAVGTFVVT